MSGRLAAAALAAAILLRLPPGWSGNHEGKSYPHPPMPAALANGTRAGAIDEVVELHARVGPSPARLGQRLVYHAWVYASFTHQQKFEFAPPATEGDFTWGTAAAGRRTVPAGSIGHGSFQQDSVWMDVPLQVFRTGTVNIPGPVVRVRGLGGDARVRVSRLPTVHLLVLPLITAADSAATLRPLHGPLGAPWWERIPWRIVAAIAFAVLMILAFARWVASLRKPAVAAPVRAAAPARVAIDPSAEALAALAALRALALPDAGRFGEHALELTRILRRYLERTLGTPRPGDTSPELLVRVRASRLEAEDVQRLEGLLGLWDRVKFARAPLDAGEARRCETAVELFVRRRESPRSVA